MIGDTIRKLLIQTEAIAALVGDRIYPNVRPARKPNEAAPPSLVYTQVSFVATKAQGGQAGPRRSRYQINAYADDYGSAERLLRVIVDELDGYRGTVGDVEIGAAFVENVGDVPTLVAAPQQQTEYGKRLDLVVWHD